MLNVLLLAGVFFAGITIARRGGKKWIWKGARVAFVLALTITLYSLLTQVEIKTAREVMMPYIGNENTFLKLFYSLPLMICLVLLTAALLKTDRTVRIAVKLILIMSPFVLITFSQAAVSAARNYHGNEVLSPAPLVKNSHSQRTRVLWLVFDELDYRVTFEKRPSTVDLPEVDRLVKQSLFAQNAYPPASETFLTLPALITGRLVSEAKRQGDAELMIKFGDDMEAVPWSRQPNIFSRAREEGFNTALFGWYHPYCRILGASLRACDWQDGVSRIDGPGVMPAMYEHARKVALTPPIAPLVFPPLKDRWARGRKKHLSDFNSIYRDAIKAAADPAFGVVMVHWPIPHHPNIYDRSADEISTAPKHSYLDNLELVDRTLRDLRQAMEAAGVWDRTVVLVTSDHWWRANSIWKKRLVLTTEDEKAFGNSEDRRVPFILKMEGGQEAGVTFGSSFNTVLTHDLLLAILRGEVSGTTGAAAWLDRNRSIGRSPYDERSFR
jgi:hypothetical protein